jgi:cytochrome c-type biogenesis protein CcmH
VTTRRILALLFLAAFAAPATSQVNDSGVARDTALERRVHEVASNLRCPVCQGLSILDSPSELAQDMKRLVREQVVAGRTRAEIEAFFVQRYGEWVLLKPPAHGANLTVWLGPFLLLVGGGLVLFVAVRRWVRRGREQAPAPAGTAAELLARREILRRSLAELQADFTDGKLTEADFQALKQRDETELAAVRAALKTTKPDRAAAAASGEQPGRRMHPAVAWGIGTVVFGAVAVLSLRGAVAPREEGGTMTGLQFGDGAAEPAENPRLTELEARVARDSNDHAALIELGHLYLQQQRLQQAAQVSMRAVQLRPQAKESAEAFAHLGMILFGANEIESGLQALEQALSMSPDLPEALLYKGIILFAGANRPREAISAWERYLEVAPPGAETARVRAMLESARQAARN